MYIPHSFRETDQTKLFDFIEQHNFGLVVSQVNNEPFATHLPLLLDRNAGPFGTIVGHMARANPQWQSVDRNVLVVLSGPHTYISPTWYEAENVVPTWNYTAVHVYGQMRIVDQEEATLKILRDITLQHESTMPKPWPFPEGGDFIAHMAQAVVAFRIEITRIEGKCKLSQNHSRQRQEKVIKALSLCHDENSQAIAALMASNLHVQD